MKIRYSRFLSSFSKSFCTESEASATANSHLDRWPDECGFQWVFKRRLNDRGTQAKVATSKERCLNFCKKAQKYGKTNPSLLDWHRLHDLRRAGSTSADNATGSGNGVFVGRRMSQIF
ncbi:hypothetical protein MKY34_18960 [Sporosarcina sp. FSL K6-1522]|uniref:hypothetical protein n=1 Tax=Sporosarcina sp. FSL K6-1522 TaxID=2921554 RepID=UPI00315A175C